MMPHTDSDSQRPQQDIHQRENPPLRSSINLPFRWLIAGVLVILLPGFQENTALQHWARPQLLAGEKVTQHAAYAVSYNHQHMQANWVAYELTLSHTLGAAERESRFVIDPVIRPHTARTEDYTKSGFDRGHLAPAADMKYSPQAMTESFYTSNISPQRPGLNRGIWKKLEEKIRDWAPANRPLFIVTGPVLTDELTQQIGHYNRISVPKRFFKVVLDTAQPVRAIGFVFQNLGSDRPLSAFALSIDEVEKITGRDFFPHLSDANEAQVEKTLNLSRWNFN
ncbi:MAG: DNA/RNA non-specific endonuclease [Bacteroidetes bacterium]|nr:DNA/RNA non-specific endonuclease [Bacteroidota bacterium]